MSAQSLGLSSINTIRGERKHKRLEAMSDVEHLLIPPTFFKCPISMELMEDPVTISTGVTYDRKNIEKWLFAYRRTTCPATMQRLENLEVTPNNTLKSLIASWCQQSLNRLQSATPHASSSVDLARHHGDQLVLDLLRTIESTPFKMSSLKKLRSAVEVDGRVQASLVRFGGVEVLGRVIHQVLQADQCNNDFAAFRACEEAVGILHNLQLDDNHSVGFLSSPDCISSMVVMLQRGSAEARFHAMAILRRLVAANNSDWTPVLQTQGNEFYRSLLDLLSDEISPRASSAALEVLLETVAASKNSRVMAVEGGAVRLLIELLPESGRHRCERALLLLRLLCECPEGRAAFADHGLGVAAVSSKMLGISEMATGLCVKVLWRVCSALPKKSVVEEMMVYGAVKKMLGLLQVNGHLAGRKKVVSIMKQHGRVWQQYRCFPSEVRIG